MSKRPINALVNDVVDQNENSSDDEYNLSVEYSRHLRKVCRASYMENCQNAVFSKTDGFLCETSHFRHDCSASSSDVIQCGIKDVNSDEAQHVTSAEKIVCVSDQKGKKVVNFLSNPDNTFEKTFDVENHSSMSKGQAFFQKSKTGMFFNIKNYSLLY